MLVVVLLLMVATVALPSIQSLLISSGNDLPLGLSDVRVLYYALTLAVGLGLLFGVLCLVYWTVPNRLLPWGSVWPGAAAATVAIGVVAWGFPIYLENVTSLARIGTTFVFVVIVLIWFYVLALVILGGAVVNAMRYELHDTGEIAVEKG